MLQGKTINDPSMKDEDYLKVLNCPVEDLPPYNYTELTETRISSYIAHLTTSRILLAE